jgi:hypothetical protein
MHPLHAALLSPRSPGAARGTASAPYAQPAAPHVLALPTAPPSHEAATETAAAIARRLALVRAELLQVGIVASLIASLTNALSRGAHPHINPQTLSPFVPAFSPSFATGIQELSAAPQFFPVQQAWQALSAHLAMAQRLTQTYLAAGSRGRADDLCPVAILADAWSRVCGLIADTHGRIAAIMSQAGHAADMAGESRTLALLQAAARGGWPCLTRDGELTIPGWAERRVGERIRVRLPASIAIANREFAASLFDVSSTGLGLESALEIEPGTPIAVRLPDGRKLFGLVQWHRSGRTGVKLSHRLTDTDPLLHLARPA